MVDRVYSNWILIIQIYLNFKSHWYLRETNLLAGGLMRLLRCIWPFPTFHSLPVNSIMKVKISSLNKLRQSKAITLPWFSSNWFTWCQEIILTRQLIGHTWFIHIHLISSFSPLNYLLCNDDHHLNLDHLFTFLSFTNLWCTYIHHKQQNISSAKQFFTDHQCVHLPPSFHYSPQNP